MNTVIDVPQEDAALVADCLKGSRDAFRLLVERYQSLVTALIYSRCGNLAQSEDLAQETFLAAWKSLASLHDAVHFKAWLCQIARNVSPNVARRDDSKAHGHTSPIDSVPELADDKPSPAADAMSREEEGVVWRTLEELPENYRLPLILFHREGKSVTDVATALDLSEDAVRQCLARGREMLRQEVSNVIESVLEKTRPGKKFTATVLAAIGAGGTTAKAAGIVIAAANTFVVAKAAMSTSSLLGLGAVPLIGDWFIWRVLRAKARTPEERSILNNLALVMTLTDVLFVIWMFCVIHFAGRFEQVTVTMTIIGSAVGFLLLRWMQIFLGFRKANWITGAVKAADGRSYRKGYAPGWQVRCPKCGLTVDAGAAGLVRLGAVGRERRLGPCSVCKRFRWLIVERVKQP